MSNPYETARPWTPQEEKIAAVIVHVAAIFFEFFAPIIGYLFLKDKGPFVQHHAKESLNFSLTVLIIVVLLAISVVVIDTIVPSASQTPRWVVQPSPA